MVTECSLLGSAFLKVLRNWLEPNWVSFEWKTVFYKLLKSSELRSLNTASSKTSFWNKSLKKEEIVKVIQGKFCSPFPLNWRRRVRSTFNVYRSEAEVNVLINFLKHWKKFKINFFLSFLWNFEWKFILKFLSDWS